MPCDVRATGAVCQQARRFLADRGLVDAELDGWELAVAEAVNNAVKYCRTDARALPIRVDLFASCDWAEVRITDHTPGLEWPEQAKLPPDDSESGRGIFLIQNLTDESRYLRGRGENCLVLRKRRAPSTGGAAVLQPDLKEELREARQTLELMTEELASCYESLSAIFQFTSELQAGFDSKRFIAHWLQHLLMITEADWYVLRLYEASRAELNVVATSADEAALPPLRRANDSRCSLEARAAQQRCDGWFDAASLLSPTDPLAGLAGNGCGFAHPLVVNEELVGVLTVGRHDGKLPFQAGQVNVIHTFGDFLGLQIRSSQMQEEQVRARVNKRDLEIAANLQRTLLPANMPAFPHAAFACFYRSARQIGGDYFDALSLADGSVMLVVADVMGKGLPAALFAFMFRSLLRARRDLAARPAELLNWLNQNLFQELDRAEMFITAQLVFLDCKRGELRVANAGHPPMLVANVHGGVEEVSGDGLPLGILPDAQYSEAEHPCVGGRGLLFTDGLIEARNLQGELLGLEAVKVALAAAMKAGETAEQTKERFDQLLKAFEREASAADDTAFIVIAGKNNSEAR